MIDLIVFFGFVIGLAFAYAAGAASERRAFHKRNGRSIETEMTEAKKHGRPTLELSGGYWKFEISAYSSSGDYCVIKSDGRDAIDVIEKGINKARQHQTS